MTDTELKTVETEVKTTITGEEASLKARVAALEADAKTFYEKHVAAILGLAGVAVGYILAHLIGKL